MKIIAIIIKLVISIGLSIVLHTDGNTVFDNIGICAIVYGLVSYYFWYFKNNGLSVLVSENSMLVNLLSLVFTLAAPFIVLAVLVFALGAILPDKVAETISMVVIVILALGFVAYDVVGVIRIFKPGFLEMDSEFMDNNNL